MDQSLCIGDSAFTHLHFGHSSTALNARADADPSTLKPLQAPFGPFHEGGLLQVREG